MLMILKVKRRSRAPYHRLDPALIQPSVCIPWSQNRKRTEDHSRNSSTFPHNFLQFTGQNSCKTDHSAFLFAGIELIKIKMTV